MNNIFNLDLVQISLKFVFLTASFFYLVYNFIVFRQVKLMKKTLITSFSPVINLIGLVNFLVALVVFIGFILFL